MMRRLGVTRPVRSGLLVFILIVLALGSCAGIVFSAWHGSILGVAVAALVPGLSVVWVV